MSSSVAIVASCCLRRSVLNLSIVTCRLSMSVFDARIVYKRLLINLDRSPIALLSLLCPKPPLSLDDSNLLSKHLIRLGVRLREKERRRPKLALGSASIREAGKLTWINRLP